VTSFNKGKLTSIRKNKLKKPTKLMKKNDNSEEITTFAKFFKTTGEKI